MEARSSEAAMLNRKCVLIKWTELTSDLFNELLDRGAGAVLVILPNDWRNNNNNNTLHVSKHYSLLLFIVVFRIGCYWKRI